MFIMRSVLNFNIVVTFLVFGLGLGSQSAVAAGNPVSIPEEDVQVLASGPIHEAFAEAITFNPEPGIIAPKAPPALIEEVPPEQKPEGDVQWIPGYWAWNDESNEYMWVSGVWRVPPPGRQWVPGYWTPIDQGYQWISGYWTSVKTKETEYLPEPPESVEIGPSSNAPSPDYTWVPGGWVWQYGRYVWQPGYWAVVHPDWIWIPAHYIWTPRGYIFVDGYWDFTIIHRGVLFAPVFFPSRVYLGPAFSYSPVFVIDLNVFDDALFIRPRYHHYYYGNYYASRYYKTGIYPWFSLHARRAVYDPIYAHQRWNHRKDRNWENHLQTRFRERRKLDGLHSPKSFNRSAGYEKSNSSPGTKRLDFVMPLSRYRAAKASAYRFKSLNVKERKEFLRQEKALQTYQKKRQSRETQWQIKPQKKVSIKPRPNKDAFSRSPIMDRPDKKTSRKKVPPVHYKTPKPNPDVEPLQRNDVLLHPWNRSQKSEERAMRSMGNIQESRSRGKGPESRPQKFQKSQQQSNSWQQNKVPYNRN